MSVVKWPDHRALSLDLKIVIASTLVLLLLLCLWRLFFMLTDWAAVFLLLLAAGLFWAHYSICLQMHWARAQLAFRRDATLHRLLNAQFWAIFFASDAFFIFFDKGLTQDDMEAKIREKIEENQRIFAADLKELLGESNERITLQELTDQHQGG